MNCPRCNSADIQCRGKRNALYPAGCLVIIGVPFAMLHQASSPQGYHCNACGFDFSQRTAPEKFAFAVFVVVVAGFVLLAAFIVLAIISGAIS
jgi:uncharacterized protein (DUF983 family)